MTKNWPFSPSGFHQLHFTAPRRSSWTYSHLGSMPVYTLPVRDVAIPLRLPSFLITVCGSSEGEPVRSLVTSEPKQKDTYLPVCTLLSYIPRTIGWLYKANNLPHTRIQTGETAEVVSRCWHRQTVIGVCDGFQPPWHTAREFSKGGNVLCHNSHRKVCNNNNILCRPV